MAVTDTAPGPDPVKQFSVFTENRTGHLHEITALLQDHHVHIMAVTVHDMTDIAITRFIVDDPAQARRLLVERRFPFNECEVLAVELADESKLKAVLSALLEAEINIHYTYAFLSRPEGRSALAINVEDSETAAQALNRRGHRILTQRDISR